MNPATAVKQDATIRPYRDLVAHSNTRLDAIVVLRLFNNLEIVPYEVKSLSEISKGDYPEPKPVINKLLFEGETALFIAREKTGKSLLALQLAIDISRGEKFLGRLQTSQNRVLYVDYELAEFDLKKRALDLGQGGNLQGVKILSFPNDEEYVLHHGQGVVSKATERLIKTIKEQDTDVLIIDPLRFAVPGSVSEEDNVMKMHKAIRAIRKESGRPKLNVILVHHIVKTMQDKPIKPLRANPELWVQQIYGSQALNAHANTTWGLELESEKDTYCFATVPRSQGQVILTLEKGPDSERFLEKIGDVPMFKTTKQTDLWPKLPEEFGVNEMRKKGHAYGTLHSVIEQAESQGWLTQDENSGRYRKVKLSGYE